MPNCNNVFCEFKIYFWTLHSNEIKKKLLFEVYFIDCYLVDAEFIENFEEFIINRI